MSRRVPTAMIRNTKTNRKRTVTETKKSQANIALAWLRTKVVQCWDGTVWRRHNSDPPADTSERSEESLEFQSSRRARPRCGLPPSSDCPGHGQNELTKTL